MHVTFKIYASNGCYRFFAITQAKRGLTAKAIHQELVEAWGDDEAPGFSTIRMWVSDFKSGKRTSLQDAPRSGRPSLIDDEKIATVKSMIEKFPNASVRYLEEETGLKKDLVHTILKKNLAYRKVCSGWVPDDLSDANKLQRVNSAKHIRSVIAEMVDDVYKNLAIEDETWVFFKSRGWKQDNRVWLGAGDVRPQVVKPSLMTEKKL